MQPYFFPYAGYFRLFLEAEVFVILDCVQFPRRGWVHRNRFAKKTGSTDWLTLPILKSPQDTLIKDLKFDSDSKLFDFMKNSKSFLFLEHLPNDVRQKILNFEIPVADLLELQLRYVLDELSIQTNIVRSSQLDLDPTLKNESKIIQINKQLGSTRYVNLSGGIDLYQPEKFELEGIKLDILNSYTGPSTNILDRILFEDKKALLSEIMANISFQSLT